jgi:hypothetical protein
MDWGIKKSGLLSGLNLIFTNLLYNAVTDRLTGSKNSLFVAT